MYARYPVRDDPYPEEILDTLDAHMERIERLSMQVPWGWVWRWGRRRGGGGGEEEGRERCSTMTNRAVLLKSFSMSITNDFPYPSTLALSPDPGFLPILSTTPQLDLTCFASLVWRDVENPRLVPVRCWERLVDLELKMVGTRETQGLMEMLREGRRLERVRVVVDEWSGSGDEEGFGEEERRRRKEERQPLGFYLV
ncbi:hypothetical protein K435DRAFT_872373 [Dendrothele bispora CBS 962.96]|uniref:Uncharacterized protein n=1 Tax=Dendrothele bispora (strain CBS 962.96) TaxID=1314807 RepID=A0A4S8L1R1_DENBC|nr:hypothetical protein K435DRAFT_872373 [Dendrothele bispora CBS 962.96]